MAWHCRPTGPRRLGVSGPACVQAWTPDTRAAGAAASAHLSWTVTPRVGAVLRVGAPGSRAGARPAGHRSRLPAAGLTSIPTWTACAQSCLLGLGWGCRRTGPPGRCAEPPPRPRALDAGVPQGLCGCSAEATCTSGLVEGSVGPQLHSLPALELPWSVWGPNAAWVLCARAPPHSPSRGLAIGRAVTAPRKEQWVSLARPRSPGRTASLSQEPWAAQPRVAGTVRGRGRGTASAHVCAAPRGRRVASATPRRSPQPAGQPQCPWLGEGEQSGQSRAEGHCAIARDEGPSPARPGRTSQTRSAREADAEGRARFRGKPMLAAGARALGREVSLCRALSSYQLR